MALYLGSSGRKVVVMGDPVAKINTVEYDSVAKALAMAANGDTVTMVANSKENVVLYIPFGVTLDLQSYVLTCNAVVGLEGSYLTATPNSGKLVVPKGNLSLGKTPYFNGSYDVLPIYSPSEECYLFSLFKINTSTESRGLFIDEANEEFYFQFKHQATSAINNSLLSDGASDNEIQIAVIFEWVHDDGVNRRFQAQFNDESVASVTGKVDYFTSLDYAPLCMNLNTLKVYGAAITGSGATSTGDVWTYANHKVKTT